MTFFCGTTLDCDTCHAALQRGLRQLYGMGYMCGISYCLPHMARVAINKPLVFTSSIHVRCDTLFILFIFCVFPTQDGFDYERSTEAAGVEEKFQFLIQTLAQYHCVITH